MAFEARTSSRSPVLRLLLVALGLLLNLWIYHRWGYVCVKRRGGRKPGERSFRAILMQIEHPGLGGAGLNHVAWGGCLSAFIQELPGLGFSMPARVALFEDLCQLFLSPLKDCFGGGFFKTVPCSAVFLELRSFGDVVGYLPFHGRVL